MRRPRLVELEHHGLVESCDDAQLIGVELWPVQRRLLQAAETHRLNVWCCGRRSGKSLAAAAVLVWDATLRDLRSYLRPDERRFCVGIATNQRQSRLLLEAARGIVTRSPMLRHLLVEETEDELRFSTGATIVAFPATARGIRGWAVSSIVFDEMAHMLDAESNQSAEPLWRALIPASAQFGDRSRVVASSTPYGEGGLFHDLYVKAEAGELDDAHAMRATTAEANPRIDPDFLRREHERDPESFRGEYLAEFLGSGGAFIDSDRLAACVTNRDELHRLDGNDFIAALDPGFASDPFGLVVVGRDSPDTGRLRVAVARSWRPKRGMTFEERRHVEDSVLGEVAELCAAYGVTRAVTDQHLAPAIVSNLARRGIHVEVLPMTATTKDLAYQELRQRINDATLELYPHPDLLAELRRLRTRFAAGRSSVVNPRVSGSHGDLAQALALGVWQCRNAGNANLHGAWVTDTSPIDGSFGNDRFLRGPWTGM